MMSRTLYKSTLCLTTALGLGLVAPAYAQDDDSGASVMTDIVVTARRVEERLQDVPISIAVFNQEQLTSRNVTNGSDLAIYTPSLTANSRFGSDGASFNLRGFTQELRTTPSVAVYFNDVVAPRGGGAVTSGDGAGPGSFFDLQNVQVLKGPQGTLFGRNTTGGAILLVPQKPTSKLEGYVEASYGNYDMHRVQAALNVPLAETFRVRAAMDWNKRDGYLKNISPIGPKDFNDTNYFAGRLSIVGDLTPDLENYTVASYSKSDTNGMLPKMFYAGSTTFGSPFSALAAAQIARANGSGYYTVQNSMPDPYIKTEQWQVSNTTTWRASDTLTVKNIISYAEYQNFSRNDLYGTYFPIGNTFPQYGTGIGIPTNGTSTTAVPYVGTSAPTAYDYRGMLPNFADAINPPGMPSAHQNTFTEELQFQGRSNDDSLTWQAGAYLELSKPLSWSGAQNAAGVACTNKSDPYSCVNLFQDPAFNLQSGQPLSSTNPGYGGQIVYPPYGTFGIPGAGSFQYQVAKTDYRNMGLYAQGSYNLTEKLKLTAGIRYTSDRTRSVFDKILYRYIPQFDGAGDFIPASISTPVAYCVDTVFNPNPGVSKGNECVQHKQQKSKAPTWLIGLDYKPTNNIMVYAKYSRGYRQGGVNPWAPEFYYVYGKEKVDTYEVGAKTSWRGAVPGTFNVSAFYNDFAGQQLQYGFLSTTGGVPNASIVNAKKSRIYGLEVEASLSPFAGFNLNASYAYLNSKLLSAATNLLPPSQLPGGGNSLYDQAFKSFAVGKQIPWAPKHKLSATASYLLPLPENVGRMTVAATYSYTSKNPTSYSSAFGTLPAYGLLNLNLNWNSIGGSNIDGALFATNVTKKKYYNAVNDQSTLYGFANAVLGEPRMYGVRMKVHFGS